MVGLVFSKLSRPQLRQKTVIFSNHAVITLRNKKLCLIFRIGDLRDDNFILGTQVCISIYISIWSRLSVIATALCLQKALFCSVVTC